MFLVDMSFVDMNKVTESLTTEHRRYLSKQYEAGELMFGGRKEPRSGGILISKHSSKSDLIGLLDADPFVTSGAATYSITEFVPVMSSDEYSHLLA